MRRLIAALVVVMLAGGSLARAASCELACSLAAGSDHSAHAQQEQSAPPGHDEHQHHHHEHEAPADPAAALGALPGGVPAGDCAEASAPGLLRRSTDTAQVITTAFAAAPPALPAQAPALACAASESPPGASPRLYTSSPAAPLALRI